MLGLQESRKRIIEAVRRLPQGSAERKRLQAVAEFAGLAVDNLDGSANGIVLARSRSRWSRRPTSVDGRNTPLATFAVATAAIISLMLVTLMLGAALLALERTEHTYARLVRGLVRPEELIGSKLLLAGGLGAAVAFALLGIVSLFVTLDWGSAQGWVLALLLGGAAFAGARHRARRRSRARWRPPRSWRSRSRCRSRSWRSSRENAVSAGLYDVIRVISACFPFKPALDGLQSALDGAKLSGPALHLLALPPCTPSRRGWACAACGPDPRRTI